MWRKREPEPKEKTIPIAWIKAYAENIDSEIQDVLEYMIEAWEQECKDKKKKK